ncbi:MAG: disulfide bond formation protein DsbA [Phenylobacterium sp.]|uniref:DsbA family protein n=1 Tax=Phenylobacterium sp. TaxID=1871053 RepID=UPI0025DB7347|nr:DsbA family protein [Phenylobacterium sp.]MBA4014156.1 disulfide bond formation protein DsbA [Phenylobacterium sp.]
MRLKSLLIAVGALALAGCDGLQKRTVQNDPAFEARLRAYLLEHPEVIRDAAAKLQAKKAAQARAVLAEAKPALERDPRDFVANPGGRATVVQFFDYRCPYSRAIAPDVDRLIAANPDVRFVFKQYPVFGSASDYAARAALTPQGKAKGLALHRALMAQKDLNVVRTDRILAQQGLNPREVDAAARNPDLAEQIADTRELALKLNLKGTPTFVVAGEIIPGADVERLEAAIARARSSALSSVGEALTRNPFGH